MMTPTIDLTKTVWLSMDFAPKDGSEIIVYDPKPSVDYGPDIHKASWNIALNRWVACGNHATDPFDIDPADFNRCLILVKEIPEIKESFPKIAKTDKHWELIIENWGALEKSFIDEVGFDWCNAKKAPKTYKLMKKLYDIAWDK